MTMYLNFQLPYYQLPLFSKKEAPKNWFLTVFSSFWKLRLTVDPLNLQKTPLKNIILACIQSCLSRIAG